VAADDDWDDAELFPEPVTHPDGPVVKGTVVSLAPGYVREVKVGQPVLVAVLAAAGVTRAAGSLIGAVLRPGTSAGGQRRRWKSMRKGPEFLVTPLRVRDMAGRLREVEIHGYFSRRALEPTDLVRAKIRRQSDPKLPPRAEQIANLTTGQVLTPHPPTLWSHLGPALVVQALLGSLLLVSLVLCVLGLRAAG
jgi:hypothetical protein